MDQPTRTQTALRICLGLLFVQMVSLAMLKSLPVQLLVPLPGQYAPPSPLAYTIYAWGGLVNSLMPALIAVILPHAVLRPLWAFLASLLLALVSLALIANSAALLPLSAAAFYHIQVWIYAIASLITLTPPVMLAIALATRLELASHRVLAAALALLAALLIVLQAGTGTALGGTALLFLPMIIAAFVLNRRGVLPGRAWLWTVAIFLTWALPNVIFVLPQLVEAAMIPNPAQRWAALSAVIKASTASGWLTSGAGDLMSLAALIGLTAPAKPTRMEKLLAGLVILVALLPALSFGFHLPNINPGTTLQAWREGLFSPAYLVIGTTISALNFLGTWIIGFTAAWLYLRRTALPTA